MGSLGFENGQAAFRSKRNLMFSNTGSIHGHDLAELGVTQGRAR